MRGEPLAPFGALVRGLDLGDEGALDAALDDLVALLAERGVVVLPDQRTGDAGFTAFLARLGRLTFTTGETPVEGFPDLNVVTNVGRDRPPRSEFHTDTSYVASPPTHTALRAVVVPGRGGDTLFSDQYRAAETLPPAVAELLEGRTIRHVVTGLDAEALAAAGAETEAEHPALRVHPLTGRRALYLSTPSRCVGVSGLDRGTSAALIALLHERSCAPEGLLRHRWSPGDVVVWDGRCTMHRADHDDVVGPRVLHRGTVVAPDSVSR